VLTNNQFNKIGGTNLVRFVLGGTNMNPTIEPALEVFSKNGQSAGTFNMTTIISPAKEKKEAR